MKRKANHTGRTGKEVKCNRQSSELSEERIGISYIFW